MLVEIRIEGIQEGDEVVVDGLEEEADEGLQGTIPHYRVRDIDRFFEVYEFSAAEQEYIRRKWQDHDIYVYMDSAVIWSDGDILVGPAPGVMDILDFHLEARCCGGDLMD